MAIAPTHYAKLDAAIQYVSRMTTKERLLREIDTAPDFLLTQVLEIFLFLKQRLSQQENLGEPVPVLSTEESRLLLDINRGLPVELRDRYQALLQLRTQEALDKTTHRELIELGDRVEALEAKRVQSLLALARMSLTQVMASLGVRSPRAIKVHQ